VEETVSWPQHQRLTTFPHMAETVWYYLDATKQHYWLH